MALVAFTYGGGAALSTCLHPFGGLFLEGNEVRMMALTFVCDVAHSYCGFRLATWDLFNCKLAEQVGMQRYMSIALSSGRSRVRWTRTRPVQLVAYPIETVVGPVYPVVD